jgi:hypothetical protein
MGANLVRNAAGNGFPVAVQQWVLAGQQAGGPPGFRALQAPGHGLDGRAGRAAPGRGGRHVHPGVVADASGLRGLLEAAEIGMVTVDGQAHRGAHRLAVLAVGGHQHCLLADEPDQHRAGGWGDVADDPAELAQPHDQRGRGQQ